MFVVPSFFGFQDAGKLSFDTDYQAILNYATTQGYTNPSAAQQIKQNQLLIDLKAANVWSKLDTFAVFATDGSSNFALIDWKRLTQYTAVNSPTFTTNVGFTGNGTSSYINTNFVPSTMGINYQQNNASRCCYIDGAGATIIDGLVTNTNSMIKSTSSAHRINSSSLLSVSVNNSANGFRVINRTSINNVELFVGLTQTSGISASVALSTTEQFILRNVNSYSANSARIYGMGSSLVSENTALNTAVNTYISSL